jgi:hypothetical protein
VLGVLVSRDLILKCIFLAPDHPEQVGFYRSDSACPCPRSSHVLPGEGSLLPGGAQGLHRVILGATLHQHGAQEDV